MVGATGFEPATPCAQGRCATRLRHAPTPQCSATLESAKAAPTSRRESATLPAARKIGKPAASASASAIRRKYRRYRRNIAPQSIRCERGKTLHRQHRYNLRHTNGKNPSDKMRPNSKLQKR